MIELERTGSGDVTFHFRGDGYDASFTRSEREARRLLIDLCHELDMRPVADDHRELTSRETTTDRDQG